MPCHIEHCVCHFIALCMLCCILVAFHAYHAYCIVSGIGVSPGTGNEVHFVLRVTECVSIPQSPTLRIIHDGVRFLLCLYVHSFHIDFHKLDLWPSCIEMRDWWHKDRDMHIFVQIHCYAPFLLSVAAKRRISNLLGLGTHFKNRCKQRLIGAFRWISAQDSPDMHHPSEARQSLACTPVLQFS